MTPERRRNSDEYRMRSRSNSPGVRYSPGFTVDPSCRLTWRALSARARSAASFIRFPRGQYYRAETRPSGVMNASLSAISSHNAVLTRLRGKS